MENTFISIEMNLIKSAGYKLATGNVMSWELISRVMIIMLLADHLRPAPAATGPTADLSFSRKPWEGVTKQPQAPGRQRKEGTVLRSWTDT